jgi:hypothetical protein
MSISKFNRVCACLILLATPVQSGQWEDYSGTSVDRLADHLRLGGPGKDGIPALTKPDFVAAEEMDFFGDDALVMGVYMHGIAKAYPEALGWWHEIINDEIGGQGISVTLCPLTGTAMNFNTTDAAGERFELGVSGLLINSNLVMYDRRDDQTLYPQMIYTGFNSALAGEELELLPIVATTWGMWKQMYPDTQIAVPTTGMGFYSSDRQQTYSNLDNYNRYPYGSYRTDLSLVRPVTTGLSTAV